MRIEVTRRIEQGEDARHWALCSADSAVSWGIWYAATLDGEPTRGPILVHSLRRLWRGMTPIAGCRYVDGPCYTRAEYVPGDKLGQAWEAAGQDDDVIWAELAKWYRTHLVRGAR